MDLSFGLVKDRGGVVAGAYVIGRDCTARYVSESALRERISKLEEKLAGLFGPI